MLRIETVTSAANPLIKDVRRAVARGGLTSAGLCVAEGFHLLDEATRSGCEIHAVLIAESAQNKLHVAAARVTALPDKLFQTISATETSQGVIALVRLPEWRLEQLFRNRSLVVVLDGLQDPGNAGAIVRVAEAFGATGVIFIKGSAHPHHPKTLRASAGSLFRVPFVAGVDAATAREALFDRAVEVYAAMPFTGSERLAGDADLSRSCAIVMGGEARGVGEELRSIATEIAIATASVESLNAAAAASVLLYEARRQRVCEVVRA